MPDMYDKLGDMLNEALKSGKIPQEDKTNGQNIPDENAGNSDRFSFNQADIQRNNSRKSQNSAENIGKYSKNTSKKAVQTGEVIKMHKYTYNMQFPPHILKALNTLDIAYPFTQKDITKQYHKLLKKNHPDTKNTIQTSQSVENHIHKTINEITTAYKILCDFFGIKL